MAFQSINLGTPNNNDGDSLYAGGSKINANFVEIYSALAGSSSGTIRIDLSSGLVTGNALRYSALQQKFVSVSSTSLRSTGIDGATRFYITNNDGLAGADSDILNSPNTAYLEINGRRMTWSRARTTGISSSTRGEMHFGLGLNYVTSMSVYTTGVVISGVTGLDLYVASAEDTPSYTRLMSSSSNGVRLYETPVLDPTSGAAKPISDSSISIAHTGFVKAWSDRYALSGTTITVNNGLTGGGSLTSAATLIGINPYYYPKLCQGFLFNYNSVANTLSVTQGAAAHYSYSTAGETPISITSNLAIVATSSTTSKTWATGWSVGGSNAVIDSAITLSTWYYIYLIANNTTGQVDWLVTAQKTLAGAAALLLGVSASWSVVRRLGCVRTDTSASPIPLPFQVNKVADSTIRYSWGRLATVGALQTTSAAHISYRTNIFSSTALTPQTTSTMATLGLTGAADTFFSSNLTFVPSMPGVAANLSVVWNPAGTNPLSLVLFGYGMQHTSIASNVGAGVPYEIVRQPLVATTSTTTLTLPFSPDTEYLTESNLNNTAIFPTTGQTVRFVIGQFATTAIAMPAQQTYVAFETLGFNVTR